MGVSNWNTLYDSRLIAFAFQHCSLAAASVCTQKAIRAYFRDGVLPKEGTVCSTSDAIFGNNTANMLSALQDLKTEEDRRIFDVARRMSQQIELPRLGGSKYDIG